MDSRKATNPIERRGVCKSSGLGRPFVTLRRRFVAFFRIARVSRSSFQHILGMFTKHDTKMRKKVLTTAVFCVVLAVSVVTAQHGHGDIAPPAGRMTVGILLYEHAILGDYAMPVEAFRIADMGRSFEVFSIGLNEDPVETMDGIVSGMKPSRTIAEVDKLDVLIVPGGNWHAVRDNDVLHRWLKKLSDEGTILLSVCTGGLVLAHARLYDGRDVTGFQAGLDALQQAAPTARVHRGEMLVVDGNIVTTAGGGTGLEGALSVIQRLAGTETAKWVAEEYFDYPYWKAD